MSVGVCIINRNGIALAADSAGTYTGNKMFYNSMNKVFSISRKYVYGVITYGASLINMIVPELNNYPAQKERFWNYICEYFNLPIAKETSNAMGLFFCGYGRNDAFPKFTHIELYNVVGGKVKYKLIENYEESNNQAKIVPLAQIDVILTFCKGISNTFINYIPQKVESIVNAKIDAIPDTFTESQKNELKEAFLSVKMKLHPRLIPLFRTVMLCQS